MRQRTGGGTPRGLRALGAVLGLFKAGWQVAQGLSGRAAGPFLTWIVKPSSPIVRDWSPERACAKTGISN